MSDVHHRLSVQGNLGSLHLDVHVDFAAPWTVLFGPSGSGKTSLLRALCGLLPAKASAHIDRFDGAKWQPIDALPTHRRAMAYVPQHSAVFPHLTVRQNLIFPAAVRTHGFTRALSTSNRQAIDDAIAIFALRPLLDRSTALLSGGELKRVSLARALATPGIRLLLLDEAFTGLDRSLRDTLISEMKLWLASRNIPTLSVTHDVEEALLLNAEVVRIDRGKVIAQGPVVEALRSERMQMLHTLQLGEW